MGQLLVQALGVTVVLVVGGLIGAWLARPQKQPGDPEAVQPSATGEAAAGKVERLRGEMVRTQQLLGRALDAHMNIRARLLGLASSASEHSLALQHVHDYGAALERPKANRDWRPPPELARDQPRPGPRESWQALDRAFEGVLATIDDSAASFDDDARAYAALSRAARALADALGEVSGHELVVACSFCSTSCQDRTLVALASGMHMCDECLELCVEALEQTAGPDWRDAVLERHDHDEQ